MSKAEVTPCATSLVTPGSAPDVVNPVLRSSSFACDGQSTENDFAEKLAQKCRAKQAESVSHRTLLYGPEDIRPIS